MKKGARAPMPMKPGVPTNPYPRMKPEGPYLDTEKNMKIKTGV